MRQKLPVNIPYITPSTAELEAGYRAMAEDTEREAEALEWAEGLIKDNPGTES